MIDFGEINNAIAAQIFYDMFDDFCACNYCNNDEWLPFVCDYRDECPLEETKENKYRCWLQMIKHYDDKMQYLENKSCNKDSVNTMIESFLVFTT